MERYLRPALVADLSRKIILLSGPRQSGKTTLSRMLHPDHQYVNHDLAEHRLLFREKSWDRRKALLILDELHKMDGWKVWLKGCVRRGGTASGPAGHGQRQARRFPPDGGFPCRTLLPLPAPSDRHEGSVAAYGSRAGRDLRPVDARRWIPGALPSRLDTLVQAMEAHPHRRHPQRGRAHPVRRPGPPGHRDADRAAAFPDRQPGLCQFPRARPAEEPEHRAALARAAGRPLRDLPHLPLPPERSRAPCSRSRNTTSTTTRWCKASPACAWKTSWPAPC